MTPHDFLDESKTKRSDSGTSRTSGSPDLASVAGLPAVRSLVAMNAASVLHLQRSVGNAGTAAYLQREEQGSSSPVHNTISSSGAPLDATTRASMEQSLGADFGNVRLHVDAKSAESVQAAAYTVGENIVVHPNHFAAGTPQAQRTLAHELTHVKQQRSGPVDGTPRAGGIQVSDPSDRFEQEAERTAEAVMSAPSSRTAATSAPDELQALSLQRSSEEEHEEEHEDQHGEKHGAGHEEEREEEHES